MHTQTATDTPRPQRRLRETPVSEPEQTPSQQIKRIAELVLRRYGDNLAKATDDLEKRVRANKALQLALTDHLVRSACYDILRAQVRTTRSVIWNAPNYDKGGNGSRLRSVEEVLPSLYDFVLPHASIKLGDATREEVEEGAHWYELRVQDMGYKARFLRMVARKVPPGKRVREALTPEQLAKAQEGTK